MPRLRARSIDRFIMRLHLISMWSCRASFRMPSTHERLGSFVPSFESPLRRYRPSMLDAPPSRLHTASSARYMSDRLYDALCRLENVQLQLHQQRKGQL